MLQPTPYHTKVRDYFKAQTKTWKWFSEAQTKEKEWEDFKTSLLKSAYRMSKESEPELFDSLDMAMAKLDIDMPITVYQLEKPDGSNAFISYHNNEAHLVFMGPVLNLLNKEELTAILAHELSHIKLYQIENGDYQIAQRIINAIASDTRSADCYLETARYFNLYTELFCDRGALLVTANEAAVQTALIKMHTGLQNVSATNYLNQAKEILAKDNQIKSGGDTHPENFIRVLAVHLWNGKGEQTTKAIAALIEKNIDLNHLDVFNQHTLAELTQYVLKLFTDKQWVKTDAVLAVCRQYFNSFTNGAVLNSGVTWDEWPDKFSPNVKEYFAFTLLDLALADTDLENMPLGRAFQLAEELSIAAEFNAVVKKEKKLTEKKLKELAKNAVESVSKISDTVA